MVEWEKIELGSNNLAEFDYENLGSDTDPSYRFKYITLENVDNGKLLQYIDCIFASAPSRARRIVHKNDLLISTVRPNLHSHYKVEGNISNVICSTGFCVIRTNEAILDHNFLYHLFYSNIIGKQIELIISGSSYPAINSNDIKKIEIPLPPLPEQIRIAEALSDTDESIGAMEKLIAKKRTIKQGAMQELLTGKRRLLGFSDEWVEKKVSDFGVVVTGATPSTSVVEYWNGNIPWVTPTDISVAKDIFITERMITECGLSVIRELPANTLLITCIASIGKNTILRSIGASNQQINAIIPKADYNVDFLYYLFEIYKSYLLGKAGQTATSIISKQDFSELIFTVPCSLSEQTAIASILSDMDAEIAALTAKLHKLRNIKQGMMSELLTGHIRLVEQKAR